MVQLLEGATPYREEDTLKYIRMGWWKNLTLGDLLDRAADMHPDKEAFVDQTSRLTFAQAREKAERLAIGLLELGIGPLTRVLVQLPNWNEFAVAYFACQKIGAVPVLLIDRYRQFEIDRLIQLTGATAWIVPLRYKKVDFLPIIEEVLALQPDMTRVITVRGEVARPGFASLEKLIAATDWSAADRARLAAIRPDPMQVCHMGPTGGTTGEPKIVPRIHNSLACGIEHCSMSWDQHCEDVNLSAGPIGHDLSFTKGFMGAVITQGKLVLLDSTDNATICRTIQDEKVTAIVWVPTLAQRLVQFDQLDRYDLSSLRKMHSAGGASHAGLVREVIDKLKMCFYNGYGGTEGMTCITRSADSYDTICCTVGRPTFPYDTYKVVDAAGRELPSGKSGELLVKGPCVFTGYYNNPAENAKVFDADGFFKTGDIARIDEKGYITLTGRIKEMINRGGESISATQIEALITRSPEVAAVAVIPMPDPLMGERVCAYIEPRKGAEPTFDSIISFLKEQKASVLQLPERIEFVAAMPMTQAQKLNKLVLREDISRKLEAEAAARVHQDG